MSPRSSALKLGASLSSDSVIPGAGLLDRGLLTVSGSLGTGRQDEAAGETQGLVLGDDKPAGSSCSCLLSLDSLCCSAGSHGTARSFSHWTKLTHIHSSETATGDMAGASPALKKVTGVFTEEIQQCKSMQDKGASCQPPEATCLPMKPNSSYLPPPAALIHRGGEPRERGITVSCNEGTQAVLPPLWMSTSDSSFPGKKKKGFFSHGFKVLKIN